MALFEKVLQGDGTWRLRDLLTDQYVARITATTHIDRLLRDADLAEQIAGILDEEGATRRTNARLAYASWATAGGHSVDFSALAQDVPTDGNLPILLGGALIGYFHGENYNTGRLLRFVRLAEEVWSGEQLGTSALRNQALDGALNRFRDDGALT